MTAINLNESSVRELNEKLQSGSSGDQFSINNTVGKLSLIHISEPRDRTRSRMPSSA